MLVRDRSGGDRIAETYDSDAAGLKTKTLYIDRAAQRPDTLYAWAVEGTDNAFSAPGAARLTTLYNERDQPAVLVFHDIADRQLSRVEFRYDEAGRLVEETQTNSGEVLPPEMLASFNEAQLQSVRAVFGAGIRGTHAYDLQGRRVETRWQMGPLGSDSKTVTYNDYGDPIVEVVEHERREYSINGEGGRTEEPARESVSRSEARVLYNYDSRRNWVSKTVESRGGVDDEFTVSSVERRSIGYFD